MKKVMAFLAFMVVFAVPSIQTINAGEGVNERHLRYAVADWCFRSAGAKYDTKGLIDLAKALDADLDLVAFDQWSTVTNSGVNLACALPNMGEYAPFEPGCNNPGTKNLVRSSISKTLDAAAAANIKFVIVFTGNDTGENRDLQYERIVRAYTEKVSGESLVEKAKRLDVTMVVEMLNTTGNPKTWKGHPGYLGNSTVEVVEKMVKPINSDHLKLAFDVYHVGMMCENPIQLARKYGKYIGYLHVAGVVPEGEKFGSQNRGELSAKGQMIDYPQVMAEIAKVVPKGTYCLMEYIPNESDPNKVQSDLLAAINACESRAK